MTAFRSTCCRNVTLRSFSTVKEKSMKAFTFEQCGNYNDVLTATTADVPRNILPRDILVRNKAISVNPVDLKRMLGKSLVRETINKPVILGSDAAGIVVQAGAEVTNFKEGDEVIYAGPANRPGSFAEYTLVDERIVGKKPKSLTWSEAAGMPLVVLTAFEGLFDLLRITKGSKKSDKTLLVINGAGGVGSVVIQAAKKLSGLRVIATASRQETIDFCYSLGADHVINHREALLPQIQELHMPTDLVDYVYNAHSTDDYFDVLPSLLNPRGSALFITGSSQALNLTPYISKCLTISFEYMFSRSLYQYELEKQGEILNHFAKLVDNGELVHTVTQTLEVDQLPLALRILQSGQSIGKIALTW